MWPLWLRNTVSASGEPCEETKQDDVGLDQLPKSTKAIVLINEWTEIPTIGTTSRGVEEAWDTYSEVVCRPSRRQGVDGRLTDFGVYDKGKSLRTER